MSRHISFLCVWTIAVAVASTAEVSPVSQANTEAEMQSNFTNAPWTDVGPEFEAANELQGALDAKMDSQIDDDLESASDLQGKENNKSETISRGGGQKIKGGERTKIRYHPYQVSVMYFQYLCGGSIISKHWVLTAAHCLNSTNPFHYHVRAGSNYFMFGGTIYEVSRIHRFKEFNHKNRDYDVGLVRIAGEFTYGPLVQPISLSNSAPRPGTSATIAGWGLTSHNGSFSTHLRAVRLSVAPQTSCRRTFALMNERRFCAGPAPGGGAACAGDSGGALVAAGVQLGVQVASRCDLPEAPTIFMNVAYFRDWIEFYTRD
ncbi:Chymotrypsin-2 [Gryllus bimaculatus]|nr:Chymotrypsin-2 [Gryllus bimaculatus]